MSVTNPHFAKAQQTLADWSEGTMKEPAISDTFECHIFCEPLDPSAEVKQDFIEACDKAGIKALCLGLDYQDKGVVNVLQSTKYYQSDNVHEPVALMIKDAEKLSESFKVVRLKLEAVASNPGVPQSNEDMAQLPETSYFEYHVKLGGLPVSADNDARLKALAAELTEELGIKIPFSCNNLSGKQQRFLNARTYGLGFEESYKRVERIVEAVESKGFTVEKVIKEFIVFDTNKELDRGWLEF